VSAAEKACIGQVSGRWWPPRSAASTRRRWCPAAPPDGRSPNRKAILRAREQGATAMLQRVLGRQPDSLGRVTELLRLTADVAPCAGRRGGGPHFGSGLTIRHRGREVQGEGLTMHRLRPRPAIAHAASPPCCIHLPHPNRTVDRHISTRRATFDFRHESALERTWIRATERLICAARGSSVSLVSPNRNDG
jgi:hypothetical protein